MTELPSTNDIDWLLTSNEARDALRIASEISDLLAANKRLRRTLSAEQTRLIVEQVDLRHRAKRKFSAAERMYFSRRALEQASGENIARYKANRFPVGARIADLCCGIGGDLLSFAPRGMVTGFDVDERSVALASANLASLGVSGNVKQRDVTEVDLADYDAWHIDPDRRADDRRSVRLEHHLPDLVAIERMLETSPHAAIKLAPATEVPEAWTAMCELNWISSQRECKQLVAWHGALTTIPGQRRATRVRADSKSVSFCGEVMASPVASSSLGSYLYEPDPALLAAHLVGAIATQFDLRPIAAGAVYLTGDQLVHHPLLAGFEVLESQPWSEKQFSKLIAQHDIGRLEVKKRGIALDPAKIVARCQGQGSRPGVLIVTRRDQQLIGILAQRLSED